eukprot:1969344-Rhodomonas_salina.1
MPVQPMPEFPGLTNRTGYPGTPSVEIRRGSEGPECGISRELKLLRLLPVLGDLYPGTPEVCKFDNAAMMDGCSFEVATNSYRDTGTTE